MLIVVQLRTWSKNKLSKRRTALSSARTKFVRSLTSPVGTLVKHHSSQRNVALPTRWFTSLSRRRFPIIPTNFGLVWAGATRNKGPIVWTLMGKFRSVQWAISWYVVASGKYERVWVSRVEGYDYELVSKSVISVFKRSSILREYQTSRFFMAL